MSRTSNTEVCESRKAMCLTSPKGSMTARVTSSFNVADCFDTNYQNHLVFLLIASKSVTHTTGKCGYASAPFGYMKPYGARKVK